MGGPALEQQTPNESTAHPPCWRKEIYAAAARPMDAHGPQASPAWKVDVSRPRGPVRQGVQVQGHAGLVGLRAAGSGCGRPRRELDVYQFGVYTGGSMASIARRIRSFGHLWGFDSFSGLPSETAGVSVEGVHWRPRLLERRRARRWDEARLLEQLTSRIRWQPDVVPATTTSRLQMSWRAPMPSSQRCSWMSTSICIVDDAVHVVAARAPAVMPGSFVRYDDWRASWQQYGEGKAHRELTLRHNITWRC